jgi:hypothetical protein
MHYAVRITAGALPRGLHMLSLSKNNISTIEGLRELTRLRLLDISYNRISRIGHGIDINIIYFLLIYMLFFCLYVVCQMFLCALVEGVYSGLST